MSVKNDLVSIITPAWRAEGFITETITSVQKQTFENWEMLIVDDCSPDNTRQVIKKIGKNDPRVRLICHKKNAGPAAARNTALKEAQGKWIAFLDSDDLWLPDKLEQQLAFHKLKKVHISYTQYRRINLENTKTGNLIGVAESLNYKKLLGNTAIATSTVLVDKTLTGPFIMKPIYYDDFGCWLDILRYGGKAAGLRKDLMRYRVVKNSVSRNKWRSAMEVWKTYREIEQLNILPSMYYFTQYMLNALKKYRKF
ncbi:Putative N-acetylgalactosaminyl-diphosphoundecaprenol glucuronosyltransferase [gamma proteobacterium IMCC1989]|nr:Putative N-acetylgalactosaminyl-diphosphoundecaprenol glucuronosyltransferase [gamma proteobacterium IMCC1989]